MSAASSGIVYRIEDIDEASRKGVNESFGHNRKPYDLFRWKGGCYCRHAWKEILYRRKAGAKVSDDLKNYRETGQIPKSYKKNPWGSELAKKAPFDTKNHGSIINKYPDWNKTL